jgi:hypothetical protein
MFRLASRLSRGLDGKGAMKRNILAQLDFVLLGALALLAAAACKPSSGGNTPPPAASPTQTFSYNPGALTAPNPLASPTGAVAPGTAPGAAPAGGVGCSSSGTEPVPNTPGIRECCAKLWKSDACMQSACWAQGAVATFEAKLQSGECTAQ